MTAAPVVLVTGAAGFVGRAAVEALSAAGAAVRAGVRSSALPPALAALPGVTAVACDLARPDVAAAAGADAIVHAAYGGRPADMAAETGSLTRLADAAGVATLVVLSSIDVYGERTGFIAEGDPPVPPVHSYGTAKRAMEAQLRDWAAAAPQRRVVALRTSCVVGPDSLYWVDLLLRRMDAGVAGPMGEMGEGWAPLVAQRDVARACVLSLQQAPAGFLPLNIDGGYTLTWNEYMAALAEAAGRPVPAPLSPAAVRLAGQLALPAKAWRRARLPGFARLALAPRGGELKLMRRKARFDVAAAAATIGWRPETSLEALLAEAGRGAPIN